MKEFKAAWKNSTAISLGVMVVSAFFGILMRSPLGVGLAAGIIPGVIDLVGLGLRLPLWARLSQGGATLSMNLRFLSRLALLGVYFYVLHKYTRLDLRWAIVGLFVPHAIYLVWIVLQHRDKGVNG